MTLIVAGLIGLVAAFAYGWWKSAREVSRLKVKEAWLREMLSAHVLMTMREPTRVAFQAGYQLGQQNARAGFEIEVACDCPRCRAAARAAVN